MQRHEMIDTMRGLGLKGMVAAFDEAVTTGLQRLSTGPELSPDVGSPALLVLFRPSRELAGDPGPLGHTSTV